MKVRTYLLLNISKLLVCLLPHLPHWLKSMRLMARVFTTARSAKQGFIINICQAVTGYLTYFLPEYDLFYLASFSLLFSWQGTAREVKAKDNSDRQEKNDDTTFVLSLRLKGSFLACSVLFWTIAYLKISFKITTTQYVVDMTRAMNRKQSSAKWFSYFEECCSYAPLESMRDFRNCYFCLRFGSFCQCLLSLLLWDNPFLDYTSPTLNYGSRARVLQSYCHLQHGTDSLWSEQNTREEKKGEEGGGVGSGEREKVLTSFIVLSKSFEA